MKAARSVHSRTKPGPGLRMVVGVCTVLTAIGSSSACTTCLTYEDHVYCVEGEVAERCQTVGESCVFSGSQDCDGAGCFLGTTVIATTRGLLPVAEVHPGDVVFARNQTGLASWATVLHTHRSLAAGYYLINMTMGVTPEHPLFANGRWTEARNLKTGDCLLNERGQRVPITSLKWVDEGVRVFNLDVDGPNTFYADGLLVHNKSGDDFQVQ